MERGPGNASETRVGLALALLVCAAPLSAQVRPYVTEPAAVLPAKELRLSFGASWADDYAEPVYGLRGTLLQAPIVEADLGLGGVAELQVNGGLKTLWIDSRHEAPLSSILDIPGDRTSAPQDVVIATKLRLSGGKGWRPAFGARLATKLPNAGNESGLGTDTTDFTFLLLASWVTPTWRVDANLGTGIVGDPSQIGVQHDPTLYALAVGRTVTASTQVIAEVSGRWLPAHPSRPGSEDRADARIGLRHKVSAWIVDATLLTGLTSVDPSIGAAVSVSRTFVLGVP